ncbi:MAG TPA: RsmE family RNA methyltransferase [bacterium]
MHRVVVRQGVPERGPVIIEDPQELHHLAVVLRAGPGDRVECLDGLGGRARGTIRECGPGRAVIDVESRSREPAAGTAVVLAAALIKPSRFEWLIQKATELGVARIVPLVTARTQARPGRGLGRERMARWERIVREAAKQSGRARVPELESPRTFEELLPDLAGAEGLIATLAGDRPAGGWEATPPDALGKTVIIIGPEGDFTDEEVRLALRHGARTMSLGPVTLRAETAALAAIVLVQHRLGRL